MRNLTKFKTALVAMLFVVAWQTSIAQIYTQNGVIAGATTGVTAGVAIGKQNATEMLDVLGNINIDVSGNNYSYKYGGSPILQMSNWDGTTSDFKESNLHIGRGAGATLRNSTNFAYQSGYNIFNTIVGYNAGTSLNGTSSGHAAYNTLFGYEAGNSGTTFTRNVYMGYHAGYQATGHRNIFIGYDAGVTQTSSPTSEDYISENVVIGNRAGNNMYQFWRSVIIGAEAQSDGADPGGQKAYNTIIGYRAGHVNEGYDNAFLGAEAGSMNEAGDFNTFLGYGAGQKNVDADNNTFVGFMAGRENIAGADNTIVGYRAGLNTNVNGNTLIGYQAGHDNTTGVGNTAVGYNALENKTNTLSGNTAVGYIAGQDNSGTNAVLVGYQAGTDNSGNDLTAFGYNAGRSNSGTQSTLVGFGVGDDNGRTGDGARLVAVGYENGEVNDGADNTFIGHNAGLSNTDGYENTFVGSGSGEDNSTGVRVVAVGFEAGGDNDASDNTFIGHHAGRITTSGLYNTFLGSQAGDGNTSAGNNTFLGYASGSNNSTGSQNTFVGGGADFASTSNLGTNNTLLGQGAQVNNASATINYSTAIGSGASVTCSNAIILGTSNESVGIGGVTCPSYTLDVNGTVNSSGGYFNVSDKRFKENIRSIDNSIDIINRLNPVGYTYRSNEFPDRKFYEGEQLGFIAQEIEEILPQVVKIDKDGYYAVNYDGVIPVLVAAIKEQQQQIEELKAGNTTFGEDNADKGSIAAALAGIEALNDWKAEMEKELKQKDAEIAELKNRVSALEAKGDEEVQALKAENEAMKSQIDAVMARLDQMDQSVAQCCNSNSGNGATIDEARLEQNTPNPFGTNTLIKYYIPQSAGVADLSVTTAEGAELMKINITEKGAGSVVISANTLSSGTYFYSLTVDGKLIGAKKMVIIK